ncbi:MAG: hypothetical protein AAF215_27170 [Cyanobacteria bacterium P01_A01_bin.123]
MPLFQTFDYPSDNELFAGVWGLRAPIHRTLDATKVTAKTPVNSGESSKSFAPGYFGAASGSLARLLPRSKVATTAVTASSSTVVEVTENQSQVFIAGDVLRILAPSAQIDLTLTWAASDTLATTINGYTLTTTAAGSDTGAIATLHTTEINVDPVLSKLITAIASGDSVFVYAKDFISQYAIAVTATTAGDGTGAVTDSATNLIAMRTIGTIASSGVNTDTDQLTLSSTATISVPIGMPIGVDAMPIGMLSRSIDFENDELQMGFYTACSIKSVSILPYWDGELDRLFDFDFVAA